MKFAYVLVLALSLCGCTTVTFLKLDSDGYYRFKNQPIEVKGPFPAIGDFSVLDTDNSVDFTMGVGYWMAAGQYAVVVSPLDPRIRSKDAFLKDGVSRGMKYVIENDRKGAGFNFVYLTSEATEVGGRPAVKAVGVDLKAKIPAVFVATALLFGEKVVVASVILPIRNGSEYEFTDFSKYPVYNTWIETVREKTVPMPNQSTDPTLASGTPLAGPEPRHP
jgi:hypothetical protein